MFGLKSFVRRGKKDKKLIIKKTVISKKKTILFLDIRKHC